MTCWWVGILAAALTVLAAQFAGGEEAPGAGEHLGPWASDAHPTDVPRTHAELIEGGSHQYDAAHTFLEWLRGQLHGSTSS